VRSAVLLIAFSSLALAQQRELTGRVTFVAGPTVYTSIGRNNGLSDSSHAIIRSGKDTIAVLRFMALSSRSSSWTIVSATRDIAVKDMIIATVVAPPKEAVLASKDTVRSLMEVPRTFRRRIDRQYEQESALAVHGRLSFQYFGVQFEDRRNALAQPAVAFNIEATVRAIPLRISVYGVHRQQVRGNLNPLLKTSTPQTRLYRVSAEYDDGTTMLLAGRIYPMSSLPTSAVDGFSAGRRFGKFMAGFAGGAEPSLTFKLRQRHLWKGMAFIGYQTTDPFFWETGLVYTRSYIQKTLVRETMSFSVSAFTPSGFSITGFSDIDLRRPLSQSGPGDPSLTSLMVLGTVRVFPELSLYAGVDGARPVPSATDYGILPDTLFNRTLRSGLTAGTSLSLRSWLLNLSVSPRTGQEAFGKEYSAAASLGTFNLFSSGVGVRSNVNLNSNTFTHYSAYGLQVHKTFLNIDWRVRFQYYESTIRQQGSKRTGTQAGFDIVAMFSRSLSIMATLDLWRGATYMNMLFAEASWRF